MYLRLCVVGQGLHGSRVDGVVVSVLNPAVAGDHIIPHPSGGRRRLLGKTQANLVAGIHDHIAVIDGGQQFADIAVASVVTLEITPDLLAGGDPVVVGQLGRRSIGLVDHGISAVMKIGQRRIQSRDLELSTRAGPAPTRLNPSRLRGWFAGAAFAACRAERHSPG